MAGRRKGTGKRRISRQPIGPIGSTGFVSEERTTEGTAAGPPTSIDVGERPPPIPPSHGIGLGKIMELLILGAAVLVSLVGGAVVSTVYVSDIKTKVAEHTVQLSNIEKNADRSEKSLTERITTEIQRVETVVERRIAEVIERLRPKK
jgi:hypothetical protein